MASAIPMALSLLQAVAPINPMPQKPATNGGPHNPPAATQPSSHSTKPSTSAPVNIPNSQSNTASNHSAMAAGSPPPKTNSNLCDVSEYQLQRSQSFLTFSSQYCRIRPKYADGSKTHLYCGRTCATKAKSSGGPGSSNGTSSASSSSNSSNCEVRTPSFCISKFNQKIIAVLSYTSQVPRWCSNPSLLQQGLRK